MNKMIHDFLTYEHTNIIWSSLNTVLCIMPLMCIFVFNPSTPSALDLTDSDMSYTCLLIGVCIANLFQFILKPRLFYPQIKEKIAALSADFGATQAEDENMNHSRIESSLIRGQDHDNHYLSLIHI